MVALAKETLAPYIERDQANVIQGSIQEASHLFCQEQSEGTASIQFDLVLCHAVIEWLADPQAAIGSLTEWLKPDGYLSLLYYNRNSLLIKNLLRGNFYRVKRAVIESQWGGDPGSLTPLSPIDPEALNAWVLAENLEVVKTVGIRAFYDYMPKATQEDRDIEDILELEHLLSEQEPFISMSRYIYSVLKVSR